MAGQCLKHPQGHTECVAVLGERSTAISVGGRSGLGFARLSSEHTELMSWSARIDDQRQLSVFSVPARGWQGDMAC